MRKPEVALKRSRAPVSRLLAEFAVIVVGVLVALGVDEWRENRADRELEGEYVVRILGDLLRSAPPLDSLASRLGRAKAHLYFVQSYVLAEEELPTDSAATVAALFKASRNQGGTFRASLPTTTYSELQSTGRLGLIRSAEVRAALGDYFMRAETAVALLEVVPEGFRVYVRGRIPAEVQGLIRVGCPLLTSPLDCRPDLGDFDVGGFLSEVAANRPLGHDLNLVSQQLDVALNFLAELDDRADRLTGMLEAYRDEL